MLSHLTIKPVSSSVVLAGFDIERARRVACDVYEEYSDVAFLVIPLTRQGQRATDVINTYSKDKVIATLHQYKGALERALQEGGKYQIKYLNNSEILNVRTAISDITDILNNVVLLSKV